MGASGSAAESAGAIASDAGVVSAATSRSGLGIAVTAAMKR